MRLKGSSTDAGELPVFVRAVIALAAVVTLLASCGQPARTQPDDGAVRASGQSMGTFWSVIAVPREGFQPPTAEALTVGIQEQLDQVDEAMSTWNEESPLSRFNRAPAGEAATVNDETIFVLERSRRVWEATAGAFDPTVQPLVDAWGFGPSGREAAPPTGDELTALRARVGFEHVHAEYELGGSLGRLTKAVEGVELDLSAVAKGFAVDEAARALDGFGLAGWFLDVGGEVRVRGVSPRGEDWRVGVDRPIPVADGPRVPELILSVTDAAVATSGDYRNYRVVDGERLNHTVDPRSGRPVVDGPASVTVIGNKCVDADAWATALMVLGTEAGLPLVEAQDGLEAVFLVADPEDPSSFARRGTSGADALLVELAPAGE